MNTREAAELRAAWEAKGNPPCTHPVVVKEREHMRGMQTGDVVCTTCGETWWHTDPNRPDRQR